MRTALISDVHGNAVAFAAVLAELERDPVDAVVCLGDMAQGGPQPIEVLALLRRLGSPVVIGNADAFVLDPASAAASSEPITERQLKMRDWSLAQLSPDDRTFVEAFAPTVEQPLGAGRTLLACHGSPASYDDFILPSTPEAEFRALLDGVEADIVAGGHVHLQFLRRRGASLFVNPGSVGLSYDHGQTAEDFRADPWAAYAVVTSLDERLAVEFRRVPFAVDAFLAALRSSGMPYADDLASRYAPR